jgi:ADP-ribosyl-[dinitrogen reductase] hydrolase
MNGSQAPSLESRIRGAISGALVGDALGVPVEFAARAARDADPVGGMRAWGTHRQPAGTWSDDGALLLCTTEGLIEGFSPERLGALYVRWMRDGHWSARGEVFDIGGTTLSALSRLAAGVPLGQAGDKGEEQNGNGSLMRILPVAVHAGRAGADFICEHAMLASSITHAHRRSQIACAFYCLMVEAVLRGTSVTEAYRAAVAYFEPRLQSLPRERAAFARLLEGNIAHTARDEISASGYVVHTLEASIWCVLCHDDFERAVLAAVNLGDDTDTTACVTGGLAGAIYGLESIPAPWLEALPRRSDVEGLLDRFVPACRADENAFRPKSPK